MINYNLKILLKKMFLLDFISNIILHLMFMQLTICKYNKHHIYIT